MNELSTELNHEQLQAVISKSRFTRVIAGAGTGKTKMLCERVKYLIEQGNDPNRILCISFTKAAVEEMRQRVGNDDVDFSTFHALSLRILKHKNPNVRVIDPELSASEIELLKNWNPQALQLDELCEQAKEILQIKRATQDLQKQTTERNYWQNKYDHILCDEFQDINEEQYKLLQQLATNASVFMVGDPLQAIYAWRGSKPHYFEEFENHFENTETIRLKLNYRSSQQILNRASVFSNEEPLTAVSDHKNKIQADFTIRRFTTEADQLDYINQIIEQQNITDYLIIGRTHQILEHLKANAPDPERVKTAHAVKGMEAKTVFLVGFKYKVFPLENANTTREQLAEENRLAYVSFTRAKKQMFITYISFMDEDESPFADELVAVSK